jgi:hypothetical protein
MEPHMADQPKDLDLPQTCPNMARMGEFACSDRSQCWEPCGELGKSMAHAKPAPTRDAFYTPRVDALMEKWDDDGASRGAAFIQLRDLARELEQAVHDKQAAIDLMTSGMEVKRQRIFDLVAERDHWKANHDNAVARCALLRERPDLPVDRIPAYQELVRLQEAAAKAGGQGERIAMRAAAIPKDGEQGLRRMLADLHREYQMRAEPILKMLVSIEALRPPAPFVMFLHSDGPPSLYKGDDLPDFGHPSRHTPGNPEYDAEQQARNQQAKAMLDAVRSGTGVTLDGQHVPLAVLRHQAGEN